VRDQVIRQPFKRPERALAGDRACLTTPQTSTRMARVLRHGTAPERAVRRAASAAGLHYRTTNRDLSGNPDLANRLRQFAIFVHGCFWHHHRGCAHAGSPKSNYEYWQSKFQRNRRRDASALRQLRSMGYLVIVVWECETRDSLRLRTTLENVVSRLGVKADG
jgi:DNA mismatch endonuclease, patch repair protein